MTDNAKFSLNAALKIRAMNLEPAVLVLDQDDCEVIKTALNIVLEMPGCTPPPDDVRRFTEEIIGKIDAAVKDARNRAAHRETGIPDPKLIESLRGAGFLEE